MPEHSPDMSEDSARSGVTGHNVRYVLAAGLTGVIIAFAGLAVYFGYDTLNARMSSALARNPSEVLRALAPYATLIAAGAVVSGVLLGVWTLIAGRSGDASQFGMRLRVVIQFAIVCVIMTLLYVST